MHRVYQLLLATGRLVSPDRTEVEPLLGELAPNDITMFIRLAYVHRVLPQVMRSLQIVPSNDTRASKAARVFEQRVAPVMERLSAKAALRSLDWAALHQEDQVPLVGLKGVHYERYYDETCGLRMTGDIDVYIDHEHLWDAVAFLFDRGFVAEKVRFDSFRVYRNRCRFPSICGICPTVKGGSEAGTPYRSIDIHFGAFPGLGEGIIPIGRQDIEKVGGPRFLKTEKAIVVLLAHLVRHGYCRLRDINDVYLLLARPDLDWTRLSLELESTELTGVWNAVIRLVERCYPAAVSPVVAETARRTSWPPPPELHLDVPETHIRTAAEEAFTISTDVASIAPPPSRRLQIEHLWKLYIRQSGRLAGTARAARSAYHLLRVDRPYKTWRRRAIKHIGEDEHFVLCPLAYLSTPIDPLSVRSYAHQQSSTFEALADYGFAVIDRGRTDEIIVAPWVLLAQCSYDGNSSTLTSLEHKISSLLKGVGRSDAVMQEPNRA